MSNNIAVRTVNVNDAEELLNIYAPYVLNTAITFEYEVPSIAEFRRRIENTLKKYPYIAAEKNGEILGYAYTSSFVGRKAYDWSAETTIYVNRDFRKMGIGKILYNTLENISRKQNILNLNACIGYPKTQDEYLTRNSVEFHKHLGYTLVGEFHNSGYKFGRWYNMVWMEKFIGEHTDFPKEIIPFNALHINKIS